MKKILVITLLLLASMICFAETLDEANGEGRGLIRVREEKKESIGDDIGKYWLVLIAVDKYDEWISLSNPVSDAKKLKVVLNDKYHFDNTIELYDEQATKKGVLKLFSDLKEKIQPKDSVLIFYAGHGHMDEDEIGYWIPKNAGLDVFSQDNWIQNDKIIASLSGFKAKHIGLITDSCFSGNILNRALIKAPKINNEFIRSSISRRSRQVITSGANEAVPDESEFIKNLIAELEGNDESYMEFMMLYNGIKLGMKKTTPLFGDLRGTNYQRGGSFVLISKAKEEKTDVEMDEIIAIRKEEEILFNQYLKNENNKMLTIEDKVNAWKGFLNKFSTGRYKENAEEKIIYWENILNADDIENLYQEAIALEKKDVETIAKITAWKEFYEKYPKSKYKKEAYDQFKHWQTIGDEKQFKAYNEALEFAKDRNNLIKDSLDKWKNFDAKYPNSKFSEKVKKHLEHWNVVYQKEELDKKFANAVVFIKNKKKPIRAKINLMNEFLETEYKEDAELNLAKLHKEKNRRVSMEKKVNVNLSYGPSTSSFDEENFQLKNGLNFGTGFTYYFENGIGTGFGLNYLMTGFEDGGDCTYIPLFVSLEYRLQKNYYIFGELGGAITSYAYTAREKVVTSSSETSGSKAIEESSEGAVVFESEADSVSPYLGGGLGMTIGMLELEGFGNVFSTNIVAKSNSTVAEKKVMNTNFGMRFKVYYDF